MSERDAYVETMKAKLDEWNAEIDRLEARASGAEAKARIRYNEQIAALREQRREAETQLDKLCEASDAVWKDLRTGIEGAWGSLESALKSATSRFK